MVSISVKQIQKPLLTSREALLVVFSPSDSVPTAWAGTLLTASLVIAAFVQESAGNLTLHHATLILKYVRRIQVKAVSMN